MRDPMSDPYRETTVTSGQFYRWPFYKRHRRLILRASAITIWVTLDALFWYWALSWASNTNGDKGFVAILILFHVVGALWLSVHLFLLSRLND